MLRTVVVLFLLATSAVNVRAEPKAFIDGYELLRLCEGAADSGFARATDCLGYVSGISDMHEAFTELDIAKRQWCWPPSGISNRQMAHTVYAYLLQNTALLDKSAALLASIAFLEAYPCGR